MKRKCNVLILLFFFSLCLFANEAMAQLKVHQLFSDNMILQRDRIVKVWGWGVPDEEVKLLFDGKNYTTQVAKNSDWEITLPSKAAGGNYTMKISMGNEVVAFRNITFGDVWICGGQSNMEYTIGHFPYKEKVSKAANNSNIRYFYVQNEVDGIPRNDYKSGEWKIAVNENVIPLSAVGYFFARNLQDSLNVPIGLISANWSGSAIEPWMSLETLKRFSQFNNAVASIEEDYRSFEEINKDFETYKKEWKPKHYLKGKGIKEKWYLPSTDFSDWEKIELPNYWEDANVGLDDFDGAVWFCTTFDLPEGYSQDMYTIDLNLIKDYDITWVNGIKVGETYGDKNWRHYFVPTKDLKPKDNLLVIRVFNVEGKGGLNFHPLWVTNTLEGDWKIKAGLKINSKKFPQPKIVNISPYISPNVLYNAMIHPMLDFSIKGVIWYQGESNASRGYEYRSLFPALIDDWRSKFVQPELPFLFVQLANYGKEDNKPQNSDWAELREAQFLTSKKQYTGMALAIDIGEANDIHPKNKQEVGRRLCLEALRTTYGKSNIAQNTLYEKVSFSNGKAAIEFTKSGGKLITTNKYGYVSGFAIAGEDKKFYWASAKIVGDNVVEVYCDKVQNPVAVRYAWAKNPGTIDLYNENSLPVVPFRTDEWKGLTDDKKYN